MKNIRLKVWHKTDEVKVTLKPGQTFSFGFSSRTDEGYTAEHETLSYDGNIVTRKWQTDGRDCDGRLTQGGELVWSAPYKVNEYGFPEWEEISRENRDEYAEAMNY